MEEGDQNLRSRPMRCKWQISKKLVAEDRGRAGSRWLGWSLVGWLSGSAFEQLGLWKSKPVCQIFSVASIGNAVALVAMAL